jgi:2-hydroxychromene-2-carboxylate isomerase
VGQADVLTEVLDAAGLPGAALVERATTDTTLKDALRANTERAATLGACGAPTWVVRRPDEAPLVFWGQDRLPHVAAALGGWRAPCDREEPASRA